MNQKQLKQKARDLKLSLVTSAISDMQYAKERAANIRTTDYTQCAKAIGIVETKGYEVKSHYIGGTGSDMMLNIRIKVSSLKEPALLDVLMGLEGLTLSECVSKPHASEWSQDMTFRFGKWPDSFRIVLECDIADDSQTCRKVVVGEKMEMVKQYELQCD